MTLVKATAHIQLLHRYQPLLRKLVTRDLKIKYRRSFLGYIWSLLNPLLMMTIMSIVFSYMFRFSIPNYPLYLICGQTLWSFFSESTNIAMTSVIYNGPLIRKVYIPKFVFPISRILSSFVTMSFSLVAIQDAEVLAADSENTEATATLAMLYNNCGNCLNAQGKSSDADWYFRSAVQAYGQISRITGSVENAATYATACLYAGYYDDCDTVDLGCRFGRRSGRCHPAGFGCPGTIRVPKRPY